MNITDQQYDELVRILDNDAGPNDSVIDAELAQATAYLSGSGRPDLGQAHVTTAHDAIARAAS
jgi:hypothetical protein